MLKIMPLLILLVPGPAYGLCFTGCTGDQPRPAISLGERSFNTNVREQSHNVGDVKNSVLGNVNIDIGHQRVDIKTESSSKKNYIDASINSTVILGDVNK